MRVVTGLSECRDELWLNGLLLNGPGSEFTGEGYGFQVARDGASFGSATAVVQVVAGFSGYGSRESVTGFENVTSELLVQVSATNLTDLARGFAALELACPLDGETVDLVFRPGDGAPAAVREVVRVDFERVPQPHLVEHVLCKQVWRLKIRHKPFVRSEHRTVLPAMASGPGVAHVSGVVGNPGTRPTSLAVDVRAGANVETALALTIPTPGTTPAWDPDWLPRCVSNSPHGTPSGASGASWTALGSLTAGSTGLRAWGGAFAVFALLRFTAATGDPSRTTVDVTLSTGGVQRSTVHPTLRRGNPSIVCLGVIQMPDAENAALGSFNISHSVGSWATVQIGGLWLVPLRPTTSVVLLNQLGARRVYITPVDGFSRVRTGTSVDESESVASSPPRDGATAMDELRLQPGWNRFYFFGLATGGAVSLEVQRSFLQRWSSNPPSDGLTS